MCERPSPGSAHGARTAGSPSQAAETAGAERQLAAARADLVETETDRLLQTAGIYQYVHPLANAVAYAVANVTGAKVAG